MKIIFFVCLFFIFNCFQIQAQESTSEILEKAFFQAQQENKNVFVKFSASWCGWCKRMDAQIKSEACKGFFDANYVTVQLVVQESENKKHLENKGGEELKIKYSGERAGLPYWVIFDQEGNWIGDARDANGKNTGCPVTKTEVDTFIATLQKTSNLKEEEMDVKKKEYLGNFYRSGYHYCSKTQSSYDHDYNSFATGKIVPHDICNLQKKEHCSHLGNSSDTATFALDCLRDWWLNTDNSTINNPILILCDGGGSNNQLFK